MHHLVFRAPGFFISGLPVVISGDGRPVCSDDPDRTPGCLIFNVPAFSGRDMLFLGWA